uniref:Uncharacterized protein n=1 Tax=Amphimedon queenslandica TaxID=400682 RepID=A0A1X7TEP3_AMPQE
MLNFGLVSTCSSKTLDSVIVICEVFLIPVFKTVQDYISYIDSLPMVITPEVFGMHPNADITYQSSTAKSCLDTIMEIQPKDSSSGGGETRESIVRRQAGEMLDKLPGDYIPHEFFIVSERLDGSMEEVGGGGAEVSSSGELCPLFHEPGKPGFYSIKLSIKT